VYEPEGRLVDTIELAVDGSVGDLAVAADGTVYVAMFNVGQLLKLTSSPVGFQQAVIATDLGNPTGVSLDSQGRVYVSDFSSGRIYVIY
jgi:DNA-binding beta-propeller fold protein YncE